MTRFLFALVGSGFVFLLGWWSIQSMLHARLLSRWRRPSMDGLEGRRVALYGDVLIRDPLDVAALGNCMWHREIVRVLEGKSYRTESDVTRMAGFSLVIEGREFQVADLPTIVHGTSSSSNRDGSFADFIFGQPRSYRRIWLPVVSHLTVVGQVRRLRDRWEIVKDPVAGLLFTSHHPARTALKEYAKGGLLFAVALAVLAAVIWGVSVLT